MNQIEKDDLIFKVNERITKLNRAISNTTLHLANNFNVYDVYAQINFSDTSQHDCSYVSAVTHKGRVKVQEVLIFTKQAMKLGREKYHALANRADITNFALEHEILHIYLNHVLRETNLLKKNKPYNKAMYMDANKYLISYLQHIELAGIHKLINESYDPTFFNKLPSEITDLGASTSEIKKYVRFEHMFDYLWSHYPKFWETLKNENPTDGLEPELIYCEIDDQDEYDNADGVEIESNSLSTGPEASRANTKAQVKLHSAMEAIYSHDLSMIIRKRIHRSTDMFNEVHSKWTWGTNRKAIRMGFIRNKRLRRTPHIILDVSGSMSSRDRHGNTGISITKAILDGLNFRRIELTTFNTNVVQHWSNFNSRTNFSDIRWDGGTNFACIKHLLRKDSLVITDAYGQVSELTSSKVLVVINNPEGCIGANVVHICTA